MTNEQKEKVMLMRRQCYSYSEIADSVGVAKNTIKSFCQRNDLGERYVQNVKEKGSNACPQCGGRFPRHPEYRTPCPADQSR